MLQRHLYRNFLILVSIFSLSVNAQTVKINIPWNNQTVITNSQTQNEPVLYFPKASYNEIYTPLYNHVIKTDIFKEIESVQVDITKQVLLTEDEKLINSSEINSIEVDINSGISKNQNIHTITFPTVLKNHRITEVSLNITWKNTSNQKLASTNNYPTTSVLANGNWHKIKTHLKGVHRITGKNLVDANIDISSINPANIRLFGQNRGMLPEINQDERPLGLMENAIQVVDGNDGSFQENDYILFYAAGPDQWTYNTAKSIFEHETNVYSDDAYYFLEVDGNVPGKRIQNAPTVSSNINTTVNTYDEFWFHEEQTSNLDRTGREWYGEKFDITDKYPFTVSSPNRVVSDSVYFEYRTVANSSIPTSVHMKIGTTTQLTQTLPGISSNAQYPPKATSAGAKAGLLLFPSANLNFSLEYDNKGNFNAFGYLDYIMINYRNGLHFNNQQLHFRDQKSWKAGGNATFNINSSVSGMNVWDITEHTNISKYNLSGNSFNTNVDELKEFLAFTPSQAYSIDLITAIENQNLHGITQTDYIIIYHPSFLESAKELKEFHETYSGYHVTLASIGDIYNEFSSGRQDLTALRDFIGMIYHRNIATNTQPKAVMLFGDASYDYKNYSENNSNFVPTFEQDNGLSITNSTATDDYLVCLDPAEGNPMSSNNYVDVPIGRLVIQTNAQGHDMVNKIKAYVNYDNHGPWQNQIALVTDDVDKAWERGELTYRANEIIDEFSEEFVNYNINKIYTDAYQQTNSSGGQRYPEAEKAINTAVENGSLIVHYYGHGGEGGWATERILDIEDINGWENIKNLPSFITTTCEFTRYDDLTRVSAGELVQLNPNGGSISLFTSTRQLNTFDANALSLLFYENMNKKIDNKYLTMGEIINAVKQDYVQPNKRRFILIGDPGLRLNYPENKVKITEINGQNPLNFTDTIKALSKVELQGEVNDLQDNLMADFNGTLSITVYDKKRDNATLNNDGVTDTEGLPLPPVDFTTQTNKIFKGEANVVNGIFTVEFIVPKDINFNVAKGKISLFAKDANSDAWGADTNIFVGGIIDNPDEDNLGPEISLYMNDETFVDGGLTDNNPDIYAILFDTNGINAVGTGIGHDISAVLDAKSANPIILNDYYKTFPNSFTRGDVRYNLTDLADGEHTISLRAWDNYNNSNTEEISFVVARDEKIALEHVLNYPNPFTSHTDFQFEHNYENQPIEAQVQIFTISGKLVKTLYKEIENPKSRVQGELIWDGLDDFGNAIGKGVYVYKLSVRVPESGKMTNKIEKLVIIK